jgi:acyl-coenzyme A thioesterase PaaI-like protein
MATDPRQLMDPEDAAFRPFPWCASLLNDPAWEVTSTVWRHPFPSDGRMAITATVLKTPSTVAAWCSIVHHEPPANAGAEKGPVDSVRTLLKLGADLQGGPGWLHGGVTALLFDSTLSFTIGTRRLREGVNPYTVTKELKVEYLSIVKTPGVVLVETKVESVERQRKYRVMAQMKGEDGRVVAKAEAVIVVVSMPKM